MAGIKLHPAMTFNGIRAALKNYGLKPHDFTVYMVIMLHANGRTGKGSSPSYATIGNEGNMTARQAMKSVKVLCEKGLIAIEKQKGHAKKRAGNVYSLSMPANSPATSELHSHEHSSHESYSLDDVNHVHSTSEHGSHKKDSVKRNPKKDKSAAAKAAPKSAPAIPAREYQSAFITGLGYTDAAYRDAEFLKHLKNTYTPMHNVGLTPADVPDFLAFVREKEHGRDPKPQFLKGHVLAFESHIAKQREVDALYYSVKPCAEYPAGLPAGISPDDPRAAIYRFNESDPNDPVVDADIAAKGKEQDEFARKHRATFAA